ncbi:MAG: ABC transporter substrate-binding protein [Anaerolineales bacterium]|nr:ABC transporter substrate-binding protein [Anaerolineales bacterium]
MKNTKWVFILAIGLLALAACTPATVTQVVTEMVEVTRIVEGEVVVEEVEVTRIVEATPEPVEEVMEPTSLRMAIDGTENSSNPYTYRTGYPGWNMLLLQYDTLLQLDTDGVPQPWLASSIETSDDGLTITMDLRDDVTWHDGEPFTADDVKFTVEYYQEFNHGRWTRNMAAIESVETDGDHRVILTMASPSPGFEQRSLADTPIIPQHIWESVTDPDNHQFDTNVGTGPYMMVDMVLDQFYVFEANPDYWAGAPQIDELVFVQFADMAGQLGALRTRAIDMMVEPIGPEQIAVLNNLDGINVIQGPEFTTEMVNYDMEIPPFNNKTVRQAMNLAIDRQDLIDTVFLGAATAGSPGWIHPLSPRFNSEIEIVHDPDLAAQMLEEAGITDSDGDGIRELDGAPLSFELIVQGSVPLDLRLMELVSEMLGDIGIDAQVAAVETSTWEDAVWPGFDVSNGRNYEASEWGWSSPTQANPLTMANLLHSDPGIGWLNLTGFSNERVDELSDIITTETDPEASQAALDELQSIVADELPFILLLYPDGAYAYWSDVYDGWTFMTGQGVFHKLSFLPEEARP